MEKVKAKITKIEGETSSENNSKEIDSKDVKTGKFKDGSLKNMAECPECNKLFHHVSNRNRHIRAVHQGKRKYTCDQCDYKTIQMHNLNRHVEAHHGKKKIKFSIN